MALSEEQKREIEEEEKYRASVRSELPHEEKPKKKGGIGCGKIALAVLILPLVIGLVAAGFSDGKRSTDNPTASSYNPPQTATTVANDELECKAKFTLTETQLQVSNLGNTEWDARIEINNDYQNKAKIPAGTVYKVGLMQFADKQGNRFNPYQQIVKNAYVFDEESGCSYESVN